MSDETNRRELLHRMDLRSFRSRKTVVVYRLFQLFAVSFVIFWVSGVLMGGDALEGKIENGRYFFGSHGEYTEVSKVAYVLSAGYTMILWATVSLGMLALFVFIIKDGITLKDFKENLLDLFVFFPLLMGCGSAIIAFRSVMCILRAFGLCSQ